MNIMGNAYIGIDRHDRPAPRGDLGADALPRAGIDDALVLAAKLCLELRLDDEGPDGVKRNRLLGPDGRGLSKSSQKGVRSVRKRKLIYPPLWHRS